MIKFYSAFVGLFIILFFSAFLFTCQEQPDNFSSIQVEPGLEVQLFLSEPLLVDPVAFTFDEKGRLYVVEDRGYPDPADGGVPAQKEGRIALLQDLDGDGAYEYRTEFVQGLTYPNGIMCWRGGVFVTCAPDIFYFKDTTGDGLADHKEIALTGFFDTKTAQIRTSHPTLALDGWVYVTSGLNGGNVYSPLHPDRPPVSFSASDGRFNPDSYEFETVGGKSQFGLTFDAWGNRFGVSNRNPIMQVVIEPLFLERNPWLARNQTVKNVSKVAAEAVVFPLKKVVTTSDYIPTLIGRSHQGTFTAASSTYIYYGLGLSDQHQGNAFICESAQNLVQRQVLQKDGPAYRSDVPYTGREFLASEDEWFRPVFVNTGPHDALYVVDMHRKVIDHPSYVPEDIRDQIDFVSGKEQGRIYRIIKNENSLKLKRDYWFTGSESTSELVKRLIGEYEWESQTAFRLLLEEEFLQSQLMVEFLKTITNPRQKVKMLWLLSDKGLLEEKMLLKAFQDKDAEIRLQAVRLATKFHPVTTELKTSLIKAAKDPDMQVRMTCALALGSLEGEDVINTLAEIAVKDGHDLWMQEAILSGIGNRMTAFFSALVKRSDFSSVSPDLLRQMGEMFGLGGSLAECRKIAGEILEKGTDDVSLKFSVWLGLINGLEKRKGGTAIDDLYKYLAAYIPEKIRISYERELVIRAQEQSHDLNKRSMALSLLGYSQLRQSREILQIAMQSTEPVEIQKAAIEGLFALGSPEMAEIPITPDIWKGLGAEVRAQVISTMVSNQDLVSLLLSAVDVGTVNVSDIPAVYRTRLMDTGSEENKTRATKIFKTLEEGDKRIVYEQYRSAINNQGDPDDGLVVFRQACAVCHAYEGEGGVTGPDLTSIKNQPTEAILLHILQPNYEVYPTYQTFIIETIEDRQLAGWVVNETANAITLKTAAGKDETVLRANIKSLANTGLSLMPEGLENAIDEKKMNNLIAYLKKGSLYNN